MFRLWAWLWDGPSAYVPGIDGRKIFDPLTASGFHGPTNSYAELAVPVAPDVIRTVYECLYGACGIRAGQGCSIYPNEPAFERVTLRRDDQRGWWVFDAGHAQVVFRDGDQECVMPQYVHVLGAVRPSTGTYQLAFVLLGAASWMLFSRRRATARGDARAVRLRGLGVILLSAWALYPLLPALLTYQA